MEVGERANERVRARCNRSLFFFHENNVSARNKLLTRPRRGRRHPTPGPVFCNGRTCKKKVHVERKNETRAREKRTSLIIYWGSEATLLNEWDEIMPRHEHHLLEFLFPLHRQKSHLTKEHKSRVATIHSRHHGCGRRNWYLSVEGPSRGVCQLLFRPWPPPPLRQWRLLLLLLLMMIVSRWQ